MQTSPNRQFILQTAELLHRYGTPSHRLERVMQRVAISLGEKAIFLYTPTSLNIAFFDGDSEQTHLRRVDSGDVDLGKLIEFDKVLDKLEDHELEVSDAALSLQRIDERPNRFSLPVVAVAAGVASAGAAVFFGGGLAELITAGILGCWSCLLAWAIHKIPGEGTLFLPLAGFTCAMFSICVATYIYPIDDRIATLASLIILLPGLTFTVAMTELASRHLSAGVARMAGAGATFLTLVVGVALAWRLGDSIRPTPDIAAQALPAWGEWLAMLISPFAFAILFQARYQEWPVILVTSWFGVLGARFGNAALGKEFGPFLGAFCVGMLSNLYARIFDRPAMVPSTPGTLILVPGSLGYLSLTSFIDERAIEGVELAFGTLLVAVALVGGFLAANSIIPPRRIL